MHSFLIGTRWSCTLPLQVIAECMITYPHHFFECMITWTSPWFKMQFHLVRPYNSVALLKSNVHIWWTFHFIFLNSSIFEFFLGSSWFRNPVCGFWSNWLLILDLITHSTSNISWFGTFHVDFQFAWVELFRRLLHLTNNFGFFSFQLADNFILLLTVYKLVKTNSFYRQDCKDSTVQA